MLRDALPKLDNTNILPLRIFNLMESIQGMTLNDALEYLDLNLNRLEKWLLVEKLSLIKKCINEHYKKKMDEAEAK